MLKIIPGLNEWSSPCDRISQIKTVGSVREYSQLLILLNKFLMITIIQKILTF